MAAKVWEKAWELKQKADDEEAELAASAVHIAELERQVDELKLVLTQAKMLLEEGCTVEFEAQAAKEPEIPTRPPGMTTPNEVTQAMKERQKRDPKEWAFP